MARRYYAPEQDDEMSSVERGLRSTALLQQLAAPFIQQAQQKKAKEAADLEKAQDFQRQLQLRQAFGEIGPIHTTAINQAEGDRPASIGAMPVQEGQPADLTPVSPGVFISPTEQRAFKQKGIANDLENYLKKARAVRDINADEWKYDEKTGKLFNPFRSVYKDILPEGGIDGNPLKGSADIQREMANENFNREKTFKEGMFDKERKADLEKLGKQQKFQGEENRLDREERRSLSELKAGATGKNKPLVESERKELLNAAASISNLKNALSDYDKLNEAHLSSFNPLKGFGLTGKVGPIAGRASAVGSFFGVGDKDFEKFNTKTQANIFGTAKSLQGAGVLTDKDLERIEKLAGTGSNSRDSYIGKLEGMREVILSKLEPFKQLNYQRLSDDEKEALDTMISQLSTPLEEQVKPENESGGFKTKSGNTLKPLN